MAIGQYKCTHPRHAVLIVIAVAVAFLDNDICHCQDVLQPMNITRAEGAEYVIIPCPDYTGTPPIWNINGFYYNIFSLPSEYKSSLIGLVIPVVFREMNNTSFQCQYSTGNGQEIKSSFIGVLTVLTLGENPLGIVGTSQESCLFLDHQNTFIGEHTIKVAVKNFSSVDCSGTVYSLVSRSECNNNSVEVHRRNSRSLSISIDRTNETIISEGELDQIYFEVIGENDNNTICGRGEAMFQFHPEATTEILKVPRSRSRENKFNLSITTQYSSSPTLVFPSNSNSNEDCICPLSFVERCSDLNKCICLKRNKTKFTPSMITICKVSDNDDTPAQFETISISFQNLTAETDGTLLFIYYIRDCISPPSYIDYVKSFEILQVLPEIPNIDVRGNMEEICIFSPVDDGIPADNYTLSIYDVSGGQIFNETLESQNDSMSCTSVGSRLQRSICAPFTLIVDALNSAGNSTNEKILNDSQSNVCSCINEAVSVSINRVAEVGFKVQIHCTNKQNYYVDGSPFMLEIDAEVSGSSQSQTSATCSSEVPILNLPCGKTYNISAKWKPMDGTTIKCELDKVVDYEVKCQGYLYLIIIGLLLICIIFAMLIICVLIFRRLLKRRASIRRSYAISPDHETYTNEENRTGEAEDRNHNVNYNAYPQQENNGGDAHDNN